MKKVIISLLGVIVFILLGYVFMQDGDGVAEFMHPTTKYAIWAFIIGALVTISLPLGFSFRAMAASGRS